MDAVADADDPDGRDLWARVVEADLAGLALAEDVGGSGPSLEAVCGVLAGVGRAGLAAPMWAAFAATSAIDRYRSHGLDDALARRVLDGSCRPTVARDVRAVRFGDGVVDAIVDFVPWISTANTLVFDLVGENRAIVVDLDGTGVDRRDLATTSGTSEGRVELRAAPCVIARGRPEMGDVVTERSTLFLLATQLGVLEGALATAVEYLQGREQFGRTLSTFQSVQHRLADAVVVVEGLRWALMDAVVATMEDRRADMALQVAHGWASAAPRVLSELTHLQGGTGVDRSHTMHRYFRLGRMQDLTLGAARASHERIGERLLAGDAHG